MGLCFTANMKDYINFLKETSKNAYLQIKDFKKEVSIKGSRDFLTNCDLAVEKVMIAEIQKNYPDTDIISEEFNFDKARTKKYFTIDPIDGTINFASGLDIWGIVSSYSEFEKTKASCLYFPKLGRLFHAEKGKGAFCGDAKVFVSPKKEIGNCVVAFDFSKANELNYEAMKLVSKQVMRVREFGAASFAFSMVACGSIDAYCVLQNTPWDIDPGVLLCEEAGAKIFRHDFCTIVANNAELIKLIKKALEQAFNVKL